MTWTRADANALHGLPVVDRKAEHVGRIDDVYLDRRTGEAEWATVRTGLLGAHLSFVPLHESYTNPSGDVVVPVDKEQIRHAPRIEPGGVLTREQERALYEHYGRSDYDEWQREDRTAGLPLPDEPIVELRLRRVVVIAAAPPESMDPAPPPSSRPPPP